MKLAARLGKTCGAFLLLGSILAVIAGPANAQQRKFIAGQILVYVKPGVTAADVQAMANGIQAASVEARLTPNLYTVYLAAANQNDADTLAKAAVLKMDPRVSWANAMPIFIPGSPPTTEPNDPRYKSGEQWGLKMINMPYAWTLQQGAQNVNVAVIDTGFDITHPDLQGQYVAAVSSPTDLGSFNFVDKNNDIAPDGTGADQDHGDHVAGIMIAKTNNGTGIAGIDWLNTKCYGLKVVGKGQSTASLSAAAISDALQYVINMHTAGNIDVVNGSYYGPGDPTDTTDPFYSLYKQISDAGVIFACCAGNNSADTHMVTPAGYTFAHLLSVSAVGPSGKLASYSNFGKIEVAAPGGDISASSVQTDGILSCWLGDYTFEQGTSDASPHVGGVAVLLRSVPGIVTADTAVQAIEQNANRTTNNITSVPDSKYGYGTLDAYASLLAVTLTGFFDTPDGLKADGSSTLPSGVTPVIETANPLIRTKFSHVDPTTVVIKIDGNIVVSDATKAAYQQYLETGTIGSTTAFSLIFHPTQVVTNNGFTAGTHTLTLTAQSPAHDLTVTDMRILTITPHAFAAGLTMMSIPYSEILEPSGERTAAQLLGTNVTLFRWLPNKGLYAKNPSSNPADLSSSASFNPPGTLPAPTGDTAKPPIGLGFFMNNPNSQLSVLSYGRSFPNNPYQVPLASGWNMVGTPFDFSVGFNSLLVQLPNGSQITIGQAVDQNIISPNLYQYVTSGAQGGYTYNSLPNGQFDPWNAYWVYVGGQYSTLSLVFPPTGNPPSGRAVPIAPPLTPQPATPPVAHVSGAGSWSLQLAASSGKLNDSYNYIGMSRAATDGPDRTKIPKPPLVSPYVAVNIVRPEAPGLFTQDLRAVAPTKTWNLTVGTDQANSNVTLTWPNASAVPRTYSLLLTDTVSGQTVDLRRQGSYTFNSGKTPGTRAITLSVKPATGGTRAAFQNIFVNQNTAAGTRGIISYEIGYTLTSDASVDISILSASGRTLSRVGGTRAVPQGDDRVVWNGKDTQGRNVPAGVYSLQLRATTADGAVTREIRPFINPGR